MRTTGTDPGGATGRIAIASFPEPKPVFCFPARVFAILS
jgi:hypothetical protein